MAGSLVCRGRVRWQALELDRQLAEGVAPQRSAELSLRAAQLTGPRARRNLAGALERIVARACSAEPPPLRGAPLQRSAIADCRTDLLELADLLRSAAACSPRAAALVSFLVANPCSPLYNPEAPATPGSLARAAQTGFAPGSDGG